MTHIIQSSPPLTAEITDDAADRPAVTVLASLLTKTALAFLGFWIGKFIGVVLAFLMGLIEFRC